MSCDGILSQHVDSTNIFVLNKSRIWGDVPPTFSQNWWHQMLGARFKAWRHRQGIFASEATRGTEMNGKHHHFRGIVK